jgi:hypothetical protein
VQLSQVGEVLNTFNIILAILIGIISCSFMALTFADSSGGYAKNQEKSGKKILK